MKTPVRKRPKSLLGLAVVGGQLHFAQVDRSKQTVSVSGTASASLAFDLRHPDPDLLGREIKKHLEAARLRERHCIVALPSEWVMSHHAALPELSEEDTTALLQIEAEKGFPCSPEELQIARSPQRAGGGRHVTQLGVRQEMLVRLGAILKGAGLKPVSYTLGLPALKDVVAPAGKGRLTLWVEPAGATLVVAAGGGIVAFRTLEVSGDPEPGEGTAGGAGLMRELRISLEQIPAALRAEVGVLALRGDLTMTTRLASSLAGWARDAGLSIDAGSAAGKPVAADIAEQMARRYLQEGAPSLEFLPPRPSRWVQLLARYNARRLASVGIAAAGLAVVVAGGFAWQEYQRWSLRSEWSAMESQVTELEAVQARIREYRPWYDTSFRNLTVIKRVVECFPDNGSVTAKSFEIHGAGINVTGTARDNASLLRTLDLLRQAKEIQGLKVEQIRGKTPAQFTFSFRWVGGSGT